MRFLGFTTWRAFSQVEMVVRKKIEKIRGLNRPLNDNWHFRNSKVILKLEGHFISWRWFRILIHNLFRSYEIGFWRCEMAHMCLEGVFVAAKIFATWRLNLRNFALRISQLGSQLWNGLLKMRMAHLCLKGVSQLQNFLQLAFSTCEIFAS